jgi:hypothetical protein
MGMTWPFGWPVEQKSIALFPTMKLHDNQGKRLITDKRHAFMVAAAQAAP